MRANAESKERAWVKQRQGARNAGANIVELERLIVPTSAEDEAVNLEVRALDF